MNNDRLKKQKNFLSYQPFLETFFVNYLTENGASEKTKANYRTDLRHFLMWMQVTIIRTNSVADDSHVGYLSIISTDMLANYKHFLLEKNIPVGTINRRLSSLRSFIKCCKTNGWISSNTVIEIQNVNQNYEGNNHKQNTWFLKLAEWEKQLERQGASKSTIKNYIRDVEVFLHWIHSNPKQ